MGLFVRIGQPADGLIFRRRPGREGERLGIVVAGLQLHAAEIDAARVDARGRAGLEAAQAQAERGKALGQLRRGPHPVRSGGDRAVADDDAAVKIRPGGHDAGLDAVLRAELRDHAAERAVLGQQLRDGCLLQLKARLALEQLLHMLLIAAAVGLRAQGVHGRALAPVEHPILDAAGVGGLAHFAAKGVQLADKMPLARSADGGVAGHVAHGVEIDREQNGAQTQSSGNQRGLNARVPRADHGDIVCTGKISHERTSFTVVSV